MDQIELEREMAVIRQDPIALGEAVFFAVDQARVGFGDFGRALKSAVELGTLHPLQTIIERAVVFTAKDKLEDRGILDAESMSKKRVT